MLNNSLLMRYPFKGCQPLNGFWVVTFYFVQPQRTVLWNGTIYKSHFQSDGSSLNNTRPSWDDSSAAVHCHAPRSSDNRDNSNPVFAVSILRDGFYGKFWSTFEPLQFAFFAPHGNARNWAASSLAQLQTTLVLDSSLWRDRLCRWLNRDAFPIAATFAQFQRGNPYNRLDHGWYDESA